MQVAGSASREHKHDSHNTESFNNNFRECCVRRKLAGGLKTRDIFGGLKIRISFPRKIKIELPNWN